MPYVTVEDAPVHYAAGTYQGRSSLLAIHGAGGDHRHWPSDLRSMAASDCVVVDLPGHGKSGGRGRQSIEAYADLIESLVAVMQLDAVTLAGHSMGGAIAQTLGLRRCPWLRRLVLVGTGAKLRVAPDLLHLLDADYTKAVDLICSRVFGEHISGSAKESYRKGLLRTPSEVTRNDFRACDGFNVMEAVGDIRIPTLIVSGAADELTPPKYGTYLRDRIPGASHAIIADAGHMLALEKPAEFIEAVNAFMA
jgi:pimeloyl-ACP methyl ester carboxylesterase